MNCKLIEDKYNKKVFKCGTEIYEEYEYDIITALERLINTKIYVLFNVNKTIYLQINQIMWALSVDGEEFLFKPVNYTKAIQKIPFTDNRKFKALNPMTVAYRLSLIYRFKEEGFYKIDWDKEIKINLN